MCDLQFGDTCFVQFMLFIMPQNATCIMEHQRYQSSTVMLTDGNSQHFEIRLLWSKYSSFGLLHLDMVLWGSINFRDKDIIYNLEYNVKFQLIYKPVVSFIILFFETVDWKVKS